jgi:hypothetical protein
MSFWVIGQSSIPPSSTRSLSREEAPVDPRIRGGFCRLWVLIRADVHGLGDGVRETRCSSTFVSEERIGEDSVTNGDMRDAKNAFLDYAF